MRYFTTFLTFLLTALWVGVALAQKNPPAGGGVSSPEPSMLLYAAAAVGPAWWFLRGK